MRGQGDGRLPRLEGPRPLAYPTNYSISVSTLSGKLKNYRDYRGNRDKASKRPLKRDTLHFAPFCAPFATELYIGLLHHADRVKESPSNSDSRPEMPAMTFFGNISRVPGGQRDSISSGGI